MLLTFKADATAKGSTRAVSVLVPPLNSRQSNNNDAIGIKYPVAEESLLSIWTHLNLKGKYRGPGNK